MKKETLLTISQRTGFSVSTVSRVLSGQAQKYRITPLTVETITREAERCNYRPNLLAKGLSTKKTSTLGLLIPDIANPYFAQIASVIIHEARNRGYTVAVIDSMGNRTDEEAALFSLLSRKVDGIIAVPCGENPALLEQIDSQETPIVLIDRYFQSTSLSYISTDNYRGGFDGTEYLIRLDHTHIACIQGIPFSMPVKERVRGYLDALKQYGIIDKTFVSGSDFSIRNGYLETKSVLNLVPRPTALFALSNTILLGAVKAIRESGLRIPKDISVVSFDDNPYLDFLDPAITRIGQPVDAIGIRAFETLLQKIAREDNGPAQILLPPQLVIRNSACPPHLARKE